MRETTRAFLKGLKHGALLSLLLVIWGVVDYLTRRDDFIVRK